MSAQVIVRGLRVFSDFEFEFRMALANQRLAPDIETIALITAEQHTFSSSTTVREIATLDGDVSSMVPPYVEKALRSKVTSLGDQHSPPECPAGLIYNWTNRQLSERRTLWTFCS